MRFVWIPSIPANVAGGHEGADELELDDDDPDDSDELDELDAGEQGVNFMET
jgi:hypothetical protein